MSNDVKECPEVSSVNKCHLVSTGIKGCLEVSSGVIWCQEV